MVFHINNTRFLNSRLIRKKTSKFLTICCIQDRSSRLIIKTRTSCRKGSREVLSLTLIKPLRPTSSSSRKRGAHSLRLTWRRKARCSRFLTKKKCNSFRPSIKCSRSWDKIIVQSLGLSKKKCRSLDGNSQMSTILVVSLHIVRGHSRII